jgi:preprotein translocase subunit SecA
MAATQLKSFQAHLALMDFVGLMASKLQQDSEPITKIFLDAVIQNAQDNNEDRQLATKKSAIECLQSVILHLRELITPHEVQIV